MKVYISGAMSCINREKYMKRFAIADRILREHGHTTINPTRVWVCRWPWLYKIVGYELTLLYDLWLLMTRADAVVFIEGWQGSRGASIEHYVSQWFPLCGVNQTTIREIDEEIKKS